MKSFLVLALIGAVVYAAFAGPRVRIHSDDNHFVYLADAFLKGRVELTRTPHHQNDWASYDVLQLKGASAERHGEAIKGFFTHRKGAPDQFRLLSGEEIDVPRADRGDSERRYFVSFPPMPAVLMMPLVALTGYGANDVIFTAVMGGLNVGLCFLLLGLLARLGYAQRDRRENLWLTVMFGFGTAHLWCAVLGQVWFTALIVGVTFHLLFVYFAIDARRPFLAGLALAAAFATRASLVFAAVFFYLQLFWPASGERRDRADLLRRFVAFSAPCAVVGVALLLYNHARFESYGEFGHTYLANGTLPRIRDFGLFHPHFLNRNLTAAFTLLPRFSPEAPYIELSKHGLSVFFTTPALALLLWPRRTHPLARTMGITAAVVGVPILFYQNTGWEQFGYRFVLDILPYLVGALALGGRPLTRWVQALIVWGVLINAFGAVTFQRGGKLYGHFMTEEPTR